MLTKEQIKGWLEYERFVHRNCSPECPLGPRIRNK